jgi:hypothetical protein
MREIKFRAFNEKVGMFYQNEKTLGEYFDHYVHPIELWKLMQFTGLQDKNGKEIYEGDIVKEGRSGNCVIEWDVKAAKFVYRTATATIGMFSFFGEVIGNIHENPELLGAIK